MIKDALARIVVALAVAALWCAPAAAQHDEPGGAPPPHEGAPPPHVAAPPPGPVAAPPPPAHQPPGRQPPPREQWPHVDKDAHWVGHEPEHEDGRYHMGRPW